VILPTLSVFGREDPLLRPKAFLIKSDAGGVLVTNVKKGSPAGNSGSMRRSLIGKNYVITELGGVPTPDLESFTNALEKIRSEKPEVLLVRFWRGRTTGYAGLNLKIGDQGNGAE